LKKVAIVGGGLAGLISGIELSKKGVPCHLFERKSYPFHRVCGEYVSNEAVPYLKRLGIYPEEFSPARIDTFTLSSISGQFATLPLDLGGFGISRYSFDSFLCNAAKKSGVEVQTDTEVGNISFCDEKFLIKTHSAEYESDVIIGAYGKRSKLDVTLNRDFIRKRSPYIGVKYHIRSDHPKNTVALHNFRGGYCGVSAIENGLTNLCYLAERKRLQHEGTIHALERNALCENPRLRNIFDNSEFTDGKPIVINEISFETKSSVDNHILMVGDCAGMITPLCGNGMAMAIHSAKIASDLTYQFASGKITRQQMEMAYRRQWGKEFSFRLKAGRMIQRFFGSPRLSDTLVRIAMNSKMISSQIIKNTHGRPFA
jgi:flavin-dependent dehydrogenase